MPFWHNSQNPKVTDTSSELQTAKQKLTLARRRLVGVCVLLLLAIAIIPAVLDKQARPWGEDIILRLHKGEALPSSSVQNSQQSAVQSEQPAPEVGPSPENKP